MRRTIAPHAPKIPALVSGDQLHTWHPYPTDQERPDLEKIPGTDAQKTTLLIAIRIFLNQKKPIFEFTPGTLLDVITTVTRNGKEWLLVLGGNNVENPMYALVTEEDLVPIAQPD